MDQKSDTSQRRPDYARYFALFGAVMVTMLVVLGLIFPGNDATHVMLTGWAAIGSTAGLRLLLRHHGRTSAGYVALTTALFVLVAVLVFFAFPIVMPSR